MEISRGASGMSVEGAPNGPSMDLDEYSGRTLTPEYPWKQETKKKPHKKTTNENQIKGNEKPGSNINSDHENAQTEPTGRQQREKRVGARGSRLPMKKLLPEDEYKVVFRPRTGINI